ncbi:MAG: hypothetical protein BWX77_01471 [Bacteroidetes bacterium ADurb.Bin090]|nr:MAG: hypothetical protein BWX77_01471 [Bacteroidetes bacterium ADurb.Bin090]
MLPSAYHDFFQFGTGLQTYRQLAVAIGPEGKALRFITQIRIDKMHRPFGQRKRIETIEITYSSFARDTVVNGGVYKCFTCLLVGNISANGYACCRKGEAKQGQQATQYVFFH